MHITFYQNSTQVEIQNTDTFIPKTNTIPLLSFTPCEHVYCILNLEILFTSTHMSSSGKAHYFFGKEWMKTPHNILHHDQSSLSIEQQQVFLISPTLPPPHPDRHSWELCNHGSLPLLGVSPCLPHPNGPRTWWPTVYQLLRTRCLSWRNEKGFWHMTIVFCKKDLSRTS